MIFGLTRLRVLAICSLLAVSLAASLGTFNSAQAAEPAPASKTQYFASGDYYRDVAAAVAPAKEWMNQRVAELNRLMTACKASGKAVAQPRATGHVVAKSKPKSKAKPKKTKKKKKKKRKPKPVKPTGPDAATCASTKAPAIVLDIDETALSNYAAGPAGLVELGSLGQFPAVIAATGKPIPSVYELYTAATSQGVSVFFITARPEVFRDVTIANLKGEQYGTYAGLFLKPGFNLGGGTAAYKSSTRAEIEARGYTIIANVGDQLADLEGGHAERAFKLPNPFYTSS